MSAQDEMVEGYLEGRDANAVPPGPNRSPAYRHGFQSGRDDLSKTPSAPYDVRRRQAEEILAEASWSAELVAAYGEEINEEQLSERLRAVPLNEKQKKRIADGQSE